MSVGEQPQHLRFDLGDFAIDEYRPIKVICVGAGLTGILAGIRSAILFIRGKNSVADICNQVPTESTKRGFDHLRAKQWYRRDVVHKQIPVSPQAAKH